ncbi:U7 snRNA-associated Sm-like protein LSm11 [Colletes gigas]|uniref:U7 snRNA-associated Sm-like protein LSm11 n=1 Tax=Colletes gigas TaxID=935657 RepID=UPI001C9A8DA2|nr:U7 snRNA-associated Sm-like protein LSm11 [Colletes gigas]
MADEESSSTSEDSLDLTSDKFQPMKALYSTKMKLSSVKAPIYDNVSKFEAVMSGLSGVKKKKNKTIEAGQGDHSRQRFLPSQAAVSRTRRIGGRTGDIEGRNVLSKMQKTLGPLGVLHECMQSRTRVKVYTRNAYGIRGHVEAYVAAFDRHWNLALEDCFEVWTRKAKRKAPALGPPSVTRTEEEDSVPKVVVTKIERKRETLERHVPQLLLRGEQVAIIVKIN